MNFELGTRDAVSTRTRSQTLAGKSLAARDWSKDGALQCRILRERLPRLQSTNSVGTLSVASQLASA